MTLCDARPVCVMPLAPHVRCGAGWLVYYDLAGDRPHSLKFEALEWPHEFGVWFICEGRRVAYLTAALEESSEFADELVAHWSGRHFNQAAVLAALDTFAESGFPED